MSKNEKDMDALLHTMEHPEEYSDGQIEDMMSDEDNRETYNLMADAENAYRNDDLSDEDIDAEWNKIATRRMKIRHRNILRIAAAVIGFVMISGIIYATIAISQHHEGQQSTEALKSIEAKQTKAETVSNDSTIAAKPEIKEYREAKLETVLGDMASYYGKEVSFANENTKSVRIYLKWNQAESLEAIIDKMNHFDKFTISVENDKIIVK
jgi:hypothetical protein